MNFLESSGFLPLGLQKNHKRWNHIPIRCPKHILYIGNPISILYLYYPFGISLQDISLASLPANSSLVRVTMFAIMNLGYRGFVMWAPDCSSWGIPCRGTSMRSIINPQRHESFEFVQRANCMVGRRLFCIWAHYHVE
jgi:hypothetical protein